MTDKQVFRQPIVDVKGKVYGYEIFDRSVKVHTAETDRHLITYLLSHISSAGGDRCFFLNITPDLLQSDALTLLRPESTVVELPLIDESQDVAAVVNKWARHVHRLHGLRLRFCLSSKAISKVYQPWLEVASFVKIDMLTHDAVQAKEVIGFVARQTGAGIIAERVETQQQVDVLSNAGVKLFQGRKLAAESAIEERVQYPSAASIQNLMHLLSSDANIELVEDAIKRDPLLSINILRIVNSAAIGLRSPVTSFKHAVMMLGVRKLSRWASLMSMCALSNGESRAVVVQATTRGKFMELLSEHLGFKDTEGAFMCGTFSLLQEIMSGVALSSALGGVQIGDQVSNALLNKTGPMWSVLESVIALESGDRGEQAAICAKLRIDEKTVHSMRMQAAAWADKI